MFFFFFILSFLLPSIVFATIDSIDIPTYWKNYNNELLISQKNAQGKASFEVMGVSYDFKIAKKTFNEKFTEIKHLSLIVPEYQKASYIIPIILIKGTWVKDDDFCRADNKFFQGFLKFAKDIATLKGVRVELITFSWSASNQNIDRKKAGEQLALFINTHYANETTYPLVYLLGHSHGGSVANAATHFTTRDVSDLINIATPVRHNPCYKPSRYKRFYQFYVEGDFIQWLGAGGRVRAKHLSPRRYLATELHLSKQFHSIYTKIDGLECDHYHIKLLGYGLAKILDLINKNHIEHPSLVVNMIYNTKLYHSSRRKLLAKTYPILLAPYIPKKNFKIHQIDKNPSHTEAQKKIFKELYRNKNFTGRSRLTETVKNTGLFIGYAVRNTIKLFKRACNPKLERIPGSCDYIGNKI